MPNPIKYTTGSESLALKKGNFYIGTGDVGKGPTSTTGYYNGTTPPSGGYTVYLNKATGGPAIYTCANDTELINLTNSIAGQSYTTENECFSYYSGQSDKLCINRDYEVIVTDGLVVNLDAGFIPSYPRNGNTWYDLSTSQLNATLLNGAGFEPDPAGTITFDGINDYASIPASPLTAINIFSFELWVNRTGIATFTGPYDRIFQKNGGYSGHPAWGFHLNESTPAAPSFKSSYSSALSDYNNVIGFTADAAMELDEWHYYAATLDSELNLKLYHNGSLNNGGVLNQAPMKTQDTILIAIGDGREFYGKIPVVRVYNRPLSAAEIAKNFEVQRARFVSENPNMVTDGEGLITNWTSLAGLTSRTSNAVQAPDGSMSATLFERISISPSGHAQIRQGFPTVDLFPGTTYTVSFWAKRIHLTQRLDFEFSDTPQQIVYLTDDWKFYSFSLTTNSTFPIGEFIDIGSTSVNGGSQLGEQYSIWRLEVRLT